VCPLVRAGCEETIAGIVLSQGVSRSQATRFAITHDREEPCRIPQWKLVRQLPYGVWISMVRLWMDSAIHSVYPKG
jgi:hypothetical protein